MFLKFRIQRTELNIVKKCCIMFFQYPGIDICIDNAPNLQVHFLFLAWSSEGGTYSERSGGMEEKKNEWEQMIH